MRKKKEPLGSLVGGFVSILTAMVVLDMGIAITTEALRGAGLFEESEDDKFRRISREREVPEDG